MCHAGTVAPNVFAYFVWQAMPVVFYRVVAELLLTDICNDDRQMEAVDSSADLPVQDGTFHIREGRDDYQEIVGLSHDGKKMSLECAVNQVIMLGREIDFVYVQKTEAVGMHPLPLIQLLKSSQVTVFVV